MCVYVFVCVGSALSSQVRVDCCGCAARGGDSCVAFSGCMCVFDCCGKIFIGSILQPSDAYCCDLLCVVMVDWSLRAFVATMRRALIYYSVWFALEASLSATWIGFLRSS